MKEDIMKKTTNYFHKLLITVVERTNQKTNFQKQSSNFSIKSIYPIVVNLYIPIFKSSLHI
jgi:hypothetical protein